MDEGRRPGRVILEPPSSAPPPEPPPAGPWRWMRDNLFSGETWSQITGNVLLTAAFLLIGLNLLRFITSYTFDPARKWSAVTYNMKLLMVQAFPGDDMIRIWTSIGIVAVLAAWSLRSWGVGGSMPLSRLLSMLRSAGAVLAVMAVMHHGAEAGTWGPPLLQIDNPGDWSGARLWIFLASAAAAVAAHLWGRRVREASRLSGGETEPAFPVLLLPAAAMAVIAVVLWTASLPVVDGQFDETTARIAATTARPWTILFAVTIAAYLLAIPLQNRYPKGLRRFLRIGWIFSYPVIVMVIQRKPVLDWADVFGFGQVSFFASDLGTTLIFGILGGAALWIMALPRSKKDVGAAAGGIGVCLIGGALLIGGLPAWLAAVSPFGDLTDVLLAAALTVVMMLGVWRVADRVEAVRVIGTCLAVAAAAVWALPMPFLYRALVTAFALLALGAPTFGGTPAGRRNLTVGWAIAVVLLVVSFRLGVAETGLEYQSTTFLGGFNLTILLTIAGIALSFPLGVLLALGRNSSLSIFRLICTGYIELVRSVPLITWLFFGASMLVAFLPQGVEFDELVGVIGALAIFSSAYVAVNIQGGLQAVGKGQYEAAQAVGLSTVQSTSLIILPQAIRTVIPALVSHIIVSFKDTSLVAIIGLTDVLLIARSAIPQQSNPSFQGTITQMMFFMALFYWVFTYAFSKMSRRYERSVGLGER